MQGATRTHHDGTRITLALIGDVMIGGAISRELHRRSPEFFWGDLLPVLRSADAVVANLECPVTTHDRRWVGWKMWRFRARPEALAILHAAGVKAVSLANNHALDFDTQGLLDTIGHLRRAGIAHAGAGACLDEAAAGQLAQLGPLRAGIIAITDNMREYAAGAGRPGINYLAIAPSEETIGHVARQVREMRRLGAELVILSAHWGPNFRTRPTLEFQAFAHRAIDAGVDLIHGHSAHHLQGVERYRDGLILYDTGNGLDDYDPFPFCDTQSTAVFLVDIEDERFTRLRLVPAKVGGLRVHRARPRRHEHICRRVERLSRPFGTTFRRTEGGLELALSEPQLEVLPETLRSRHETAA